ncbi:ectoine hydroxylase [Gammaproteobacteria bacterium AB-CW1]|uniref:Ectoine hydroxylase n=1 Tax=Natronospira elongata TaxID=3110268 RepID=A0AAP6JDY2_9GAMM|nr:ectoine hydroxylase [Gammaproteobacteria bacterium AB-CW1]
MAVTVRELHETRQTGTHTDIYPTRVQDEARIIPRKDPIVYGDIDDGPLGQQELSRYERDGFLFLTGLFSESEVEMYRRELRRLDARADNSKRPEVITEPGSESIRSIFSIHRNDDLFGRLCRDPRVLDVAQQLLGSDVYVHQSRVNYKPGFTGKEFYWHSDFETWHAEDGMPRMRAVSCSILLTDNKAFNGALMLIPGSHRHFISCVGETPEDNHLSSLKAQEVGVPDQESLSWLVQQGGIHVPEGPAGSVLFFECNTMHGSNGNITPLPRSNAFFVFNSMENRLQAPYAAPRHRPQWLAERDHTRALRHL